MVALGTIGLLFAFIIGLILFLVYRDLLFKIIKEAIVSSVLAIAALSILNLIVTIPISLYGLLLLAFFCISALTHYYLNKTAPQQPQGKQDDLKDIMGL